MTKPNGTDTLTDIGGVWFLGEAVWKPIGELIATEPGTGPVLIEGTDGDDFLYGTNGDDMVNMGKGLDVISGSAGNDIIHGDEGYNQVDYDGSVSDSSFRRLCRNFDLENRTLIGRI